MSYTFVGFAPCGCPRLFVVDDPSMAREIRTELPRAMREGYEAKRMLTEDVRRLDWHCPHRERPETANQGVMAL